MSKVMRASARIHSKGVLPFWPFAYNRLHCFFVTLTEKQTDGVRSNRGSRPGGCYDVQPLYTWIFN